MESKTELLNKACDLAVYSWKRRLKGIYFWWEEKRYTKEFCIEQIDYFTKMKTK